MLCKEHSRKKGLKVEGLEEGGRPGFNEHTHDIHTKIHAYIHTKGNKYKINTSILRNNGFSSRPPQ